MGWQPLESFVAKGPSGGDVPAPGAYDDIEFKLMETGKMISKDEHTNLWVG